MRNRPFTPSTPSHSTPASLLSDMLGGFGGSRGVLTGILGEGADENAFIHSPHSTRRRPIISRLRLGAVEVRTPPDSPLTPPAHRPITVGARRSTQAGRAEEFETPTYGVGDVPRSRCARRYATSSAVRQVRGCLRVRLCQTSVDPCRLFAVSISSRKGSSDRRESSLMGCYCGLTPGEDRYRSAAPNPSS